MRSNFPRNHRLLYQLQVIVAAHALHSATANLFINIYHLKTVLWGWKRLFEGRNSQCASLQASSGSYIAPTTCFLHLFFYSQLGIKIVFVIVNVIVHAQRVFVIVIVIVIVIVVKLFENNFTPILDIDTTRGICYGAALQVVVGSKGCITCDGRDGCHFVYIEQVDFILTCYNC